MNGTDYYKIDGFSTGRMLATMKSLRRTGGAAEPDVEAVVRAMAKGHAVTDLADVATKIRRTVEIYRGRVPAAAGAAAAAAAAAATGAAASTPVSVGGSRSCG